MLSALADRGIRRPRRILIGALVAFVVAAVLGGPVAGQLDSANGFEDPGSSSVAASDAIQRASGVDAAPGIIAVVDTPAGAAGAQGRQRLAQVAGVLRRVPGVAGVRTPADPGGRALVAADGRSALVTASLRASADEADVVTHATDRLAPVPGVTLGGSAVANEQIGDQVNSDLGRAELLAFPMLALLALVFFRGARAAALPLMVGALAVVSSFLTIRIIDGFYGLSVYSLNVVFGLGLGLAIDYALFLVSRFREELGAGRDVPDAVRIAMGTAGRTVVFSSLTVA